MEEGGEEEFSLPVFQETGVWVTEPTCLFCLFFPACGPTLTWTSYTPFPLSVALLTDLVNQHLREISQALGAVFLEDGMNELSYFYSR